MPNGRPPGLPKTGGRKPGTPNKATKELRDIAQQFAPNALAELARLAREAESEATRVAAIRELLDRAYGKAPPGTPIGEPVSATFDADGARKSILEKLRRIGAADGDVTGGGEPFYRPAR